MSMTSYFKLNFVQAVTHLDEMMRDLDSADACVEIDWLSNEWWPLRICVEKNKKLKEEHFIFPLEL